MPSADSPGHTAAVLATFAAASALLVLPFIASGAGDARSPSSTFHDDAPAASAPVSVRGLSSSAESRAALDRAWDRLEVDEGRGGPSASSEEAGPGSASDEEGFTPAPFDSSSASAPGEADGSASSDDGLSAAELAAEARRIEAATAELQPAPQPPVRVSVDRDSIGITGRIGLD
jgi:hypothetical protein